MEAVSQIGFSPDFQTWIQLATCFLENLPAIQLKDVLASTARSIGGNFCMSILQLFQQNKKKSLPEPAATKSSPHFS